MHGGCDLSHHHPYPVQARQHHGVVVAVGPGKTEDGTLVKIDLKKGQKVIYKKYSGTEVKEGKKEYLLIKAEDILAVVE